MIDTERLILRPWHDDDAADLLAICSDPRVMATIGPLQNKDQVRATIANQQALQARDGFCYWAMEHRRSGAVIGFCGLETQAAQMPIAGKVDIGWRLAHDHWGKGYAREAAAACLGWAWASTDLDEVIAITASSNTRSWGLMERLGMQRVMDGDFDHPDVPDDSPLKRHVLYRIGRPT